MDTDVNHSSEYLAKETEHLRNTFAELRKESRSLEAYTILSVGVVWGWCAKNSDSSQVELLIWFPLIIIILFGTRALGIYMQMRTIREYLVKIELTRELPNELGWERFLNKHQVQAIWPTTAFAFWLTLNILTIFVPLHFM